MVKGFSLLLVCLLVGEGVAHVYRLPVPGSICGMALLFGCLVWSGEPVSGDLGKAADGLLANLGLLFVPAGVGVMASWHLIAHDWLIITIALVVSTGVAIAATALAGVWISALRTNARKSQFEAVPVAANPSKSTRAGSTP